MEEETSPEDGLPPEEPGDDEGTIAVSRWRRNGYATGAVARGALAAFSLAALAALLVGGRTAEVVFAAACVAFPVALIAVGAARRGRVGRPLGAVLAALLAILALSLLAMFLLRGRVGEAPWVAGLPLSTAILLGGVWLLPLALVGLAYALTFDRHGLTPEDLERLRGLAASPGPLRPAGTGGPSQKPTGAEEPGDRPASRSTGSAAPPPSRPPTRSDESGGAGGPEVPGPSSDPDPDPGPDPGP